MKITTLTLTLFLMAGCSDSGTGEPAEAGADSSDPVDASGTPDGHGPLWPCDTPGASCNAHDPCAINPICGKDRLCHPSKLQSCDDGLACTVDTCKGMGLCENTPIKGTCKLMVTAASAADGGADGGAPDATSTSTQACFNDGDKNPGDSCQECDPDTSSTSWSNSNGGYCDDRKPCTKDDYCQNGICKGIDYQSQCQDAYSCTDDLCDGKGGCLGNKLKSTHCLINGTCHKDSDNHPSGTCYTCDVSTSQSGWTPIANTCMIGGKCYKSGDKNAGGCAECAPATSSTTWTVKNTTHCLIGGACLASGTKDSIGCSACDPTKDRYAYTALPGMCKIAGTCHASGAKHTGGCAECAPLTSATSWTVKGTTHCLINDVCTASGGKDTTGCGVCDPTQDRYAYSAVTGQCKIDGACYASGAKHPKACAECAPATSSTSWTLTSTTTDCLIKNECYAANTTLGCFKCDPTTSQTSWTQIAGCTYLDMAIGTHGSVYTDSGHTRGYWFVAPVNFTIIGLRVPAAAGTGVQNVEVLKFSVTPTLAGTTAYTSLFYAKGVAGTNYISASVAVKKGDIIGVVGARGTTTMYNSYASAYTFATTISAQSVTLKRLMVQNNLYSSKSSGSVVSNDHYYGRIELRYTP